MSKKSFVFSVEYEFIADTEEDARIEFQQMLDDWDWGGALMNADNWSVSVEDVDVTE